MSTITRRCAKCKKTKPASSFHIRRSREGRKQTWVSYCKPCWYQRHFRLSLQRKYGITWDEYKKMWAKQQGKCPACSIWLQLPASARGGRSHLKWQTACVHHAHHGRRRALGLWCGRCNAGFGMFEDNPRLARQAAKAHEDALHDHQPDEVD